MVLGWTRYQYYENDKYTTDEQKKFKKDVYARLKHTRKDGISAGALAKELSGDIHMVYDMLAAKPRPMSAWVAMDEALKKLGY